MLEQIILFFFAIIFFVMALTCFIQYNKKVIVFDAKVKRMKCIQGNAKANSNSNTFSENKRNDYFFHYKNKHTETDIELYERCTLELEYDQKDLHPELKSKKINIILKDVNTGTGYLKNQTIQLEADCDNKKRIRICCINYIALLFSGIFFIIIGSLLLVSIYFVKNNNIKKSNLNISSN